MKFQLQSGNPVPPKRTEKKYPWLKGMRVGDNVLLETESDARKVRDVMRKNGMKYAVRKIDGKGWGVWYLGERDAA